MKISPTTVVRQPKAPARITMAVKSRLASSPFPSPIFVEQSTDAPLKSSDSAMKSMKIGMAMLKAASALVPTKRERNRPSSSVESSDMENCAKTGGATNRINSRVV